MKIFQESILPAKKAAQDFLELFKRLHLTLDIHYILDTLNDFFFSEYPDLIYNYAFIDEGKANLVFYSTKLHGEYRKLENITHQQKIPLTANDPHTQACLKRKVLFADKSSISGFSQETQMRFHYIKLSYAAYIPIVQESEVLGVLSIGSLREPIEHSLVDTLFVSFGEHLFSLLKNALHYSRLLENAANIHTVLARTRKVLEVAEQINNLTSRENLYQLILTELLALFHFDYGSILLEEKGRLELRAATSASDEYMAYADEMKIYMKKIGGLETDYSSGALGLVYLQNTTLFFPNLDSVTHFDVSEKLRGVMDILKENKSYLGIPIRRGGRAIGVLGLNSFKNPVSLSDFEIKTLESLGSFIGSALENANLYSVVENQRSLLESKDRIISEDLYMAKRIQRKLISPPVSLPGLDLFVHYQPQGEIGGDIYDIHQLADNYYRLFLADATGHGIQAALMTLIIKNEYDKVKDEHASPSVLLGKLNDSFISNYYHLTVFFTGIVVDLDLFHQQITYSSAGHPTQYLIREKEIVPLRSCGKMIGLKENQKYRGETFDLHTKEKLFLFTDGLFEEYYDEQQDSVGEEKIFSFIRKYQAFPIRTLCKNVLRDTQFLVGSKDFADDVSLLGLQVK